MIKSEIFNTIPEAIAEMANGRMVIVVDDEDRENEGDLIMAAHYVTPESVNFMIKHGRGLVCLPVTDEILSRMEIEEMVTKNRDSYNTAFTVSVDASKSHGISTGISASDRATTIQVLINSNSTKKDIVTPGHVFPLRARQMGVLKRAGHTEAAVDLARLAGLEPAGVICEIIKEDGQMARVPDLVEFAKNHNLKMVTIKDLIRYRLKEEIFITKIEETSLPTDYGEFMVTAFKDEINNETHLALVKGKIEKDNNILVRVHSECLTGDVFHSQRCDCGDQLHEAMKMIQKKGSGVLLYIRQEGRGIGLANKIRAYKLQEKGCDTVEANLKLGFKADLRDYGVGAQILRALDIKNMDLITNNPAKIVGLGGYGLKIHKRIPLVIEANKHNKKYLNTKSERLGHMF
ncbi:bifunctional 3,4-dihydroxy-2-butanone-4-phosphate synthase/GTP cyclohydrolase II [Candidatus Margulisiibacteriota bacterium]